MKESKIREKTEKRKATSLILKNLTNFSFFALLGAIICRSPKDLKKTVFLWILAILSVMVITKAALLLRQGGEISPNIDYYETFQD